MPTLDPLYSYRYRCEQCRTTSPLVASRREVEAERDRHRQVVHAGHIPDGERIIRPQPRPGTPSKPIHYVAYAAAVAALALIIWVRHFA
ncbi:hypothetical protein ACFYNY_36245 [Streptomyces sp. NPDC006530]|uniref:hypothetical protein n=1 Tax=Streptomyces sp. NPDC006530 TaxID=3364750 RepID=UPI003677CA3F